MSLFLVIFRATVRELDEEYSQMAVRMRELALSQFGCLEFKAYMEGAEEIALSYWPDEASIQAWREHPEHLEAQRLGLTRWYSSYRVEIAKITREYRRGAC